MYRLIPLRTLRNTQKVKFHEMVPSDIPLIHGIDRVIHEPYATSPGPVDDCPNLVQRPWYMHPGQDDNLMVLQGTRYIDIYCPKRKEKASFIVTPDKIYKNDRLYYDGSAMVVWPAGIFHRIISGDEGSISINFATRTSKFNLDDNFNIYNLSVYSGEYHVIKDGSEDQPDLMYKYPNKELKSMFKDE